MSQKYSLTVLFDSAEDHSWAMKQIEAQIKKGGVSQCALSRASSVTDTTETQGDTHTEDGQLLTRQPRPVGTRGIDASGISDVELLSTLGMELEHSKAEGGYWGFLFKDGSRLTMLEHRDQLRPWLKKKGYIL